MRLFRSYLINTIFGKQSTHKNIGYKHHHEDERTIGKPFEYIDDPYYIGQ